MDKPFEEWRDVVGYEGLYMVSSFGRVISFHKTKSGTLLRPAIASHGYPTIVLWKDKKGKTTSVHRLVLESFVGPCPEGMEACHNNGVRSDARLENLRWAPRAENQRDKILHNTYVHGENVSSSVLKYEDVFCIRHLASRGMTHRELSNIFGVSRPTISNVVSKETWCDVELTVEKKLKSVN